jgi:hypothetical protein
LAALAAPAAVMVFQMKALTGSKAKYDDKRAHLHTVFRAYVAMQSARPAQ